MLFRPELLLQISSYPNSSQCRVGIDTIHWSKIPSLMGNEPVPHPIMNSMQYLCVPFLWRFLHFSVRVFPFFSHFLPFTWFSYFSYAKYKFKKDLFSKLLLISKITFSCWQQSTYKCGFMLRLLMQVHFVSLILEYVIQMPVLNTSHVFNSTYIFI
jgi:hypothetical protein